MDWLFWLWLFFAVSSFNDLILIMDWVKNIIMFLWPFLWFSCLAILITLLVMEGCALAVAFLHGVTAFAKKLWHDFRTWIQRASKEDEAAAGTNNAGQERAFISVRAHNGTDNGAAAGQVVVRYGDRVTVMDEAAAGTNNAGQKSAFVSVGAHNGTDNGAAAGQVVVRYGHRVTVMDEAAAGTNNAGQKHAFVRVGAHNGTDNGAAAGQVVVRYGDRVTVWVGGIADVQAGLWETDMDEGGAQGRDADTDLLQPTA
ncbi:uncharacterized protein LOC130908444 [Corythoichthys intestinalis]|uniref:uncharacterized protein LOC130908444 n=1 Tax=Corythoichthys intestinalis TaxID=161448 RepID=UPI0025A57DB8|nr:uncharacterized protein LOC130908444 [Corythoichthys intestinalis]